jgi:hypothetical protein
VIQTVDEARWKQSAKKLNKTPKTYLSAFKNLIAEEKN